MRMIGALLLTAAVMVAAPWSLDVAGQAGGGDVQEIRKVAETYRKASLAGDAKAVAALYADDAVEMPPNQPAVRGRTEIEAYYRKMMEGAKLTSLELKHMDTQASGNIGYDVGSYSQAVQPAGGGTMKQSGYYTITLKKVGGAWKVASAIYHPDSPPQQGAGQQQP